MASLYFRYGAMNSGKSIDIIKVAHNYEERGQRAIILTSSLDVRSGHNKIQSRIGIEREAFSISSNDIIMDMFISVEKHTKLVHKNNADIMFDCILVDEAQFLTKKQVYELGKLVDEYNIPVICYGLRSDFKHEPFEGSIYLMTIADKIEELPTVCWCGKRASVNARVIDGIIENDGEQVQIGGNETYVTLCRKHFYERKLK